MSIDLTAIIAALPAHLTVAAALDEGGQGSVFIGTCGGQESAIKLFDPRGDERRVEREIELLREIDLPSVVRILDACKIEVNGQPIHVVAYELHKNGDLRPLVQRAGGAPLGFDLLKRCASDTTQAVESIWQRRVVHRDIKPANILCRHDHGFVVVDFGFARHLDHSDMTQPGASPGTIGYKSPEQAMGRRSLTIKSDVFSLGVTLYELATGVHPFQRNQSIIGRTQAKPLRSHRRDLPQAFCQLIDQMLNTVPSARPGNLTIRLSAL